MLPSHQSSPRNSPSRIIKGDFVRGKRPFIRYVALACVVLVSLWLFAPAFPDFSPTLHYQVPLEDLPLPATRTTDSDKEQTIDNSRTLGTPPAIKTVSSVKGPVPTLETIWDTRKGEVRNAFKHAWSGYMSKAYPNDELLSVSGRHSNNFNGWSVTLVDSLDTMWIMGLRQEFSEAVLNISRQRYSTSKGGFAPFFETVIRYLGGLLSAYALSGERILLSQADDLGRVLLPIFNASASGLPAFSINLKTGETKWNEWGNMIYFAEMTSCQLEYKYLAKLTGRAEYYEKVEQVMDVFYRANITDGLFEERWYNTGIAMGSRYTIGGGVDSGYEYLLKQWSLTGDVRARDQYIKSAEGIINNLLFVTPKRQLLYVTDLNSGYSSHHMEHLACFLPGMLALGAHSLELPEPVKELHQWAAEGLAYTCWVMYADQKSGLGPDGADMLHGRNWVDSVREWEKEGRPGGKPPGLGEALPEKDMRKRDYVNTWPGAYLLRPETVESLYILWKTTGDTRWRERGYIIFEAIEKVAKTEFGYASVDSIDLAPVHRDDMPSYFLAETLKYLYLLFDDSDPFSLDKWVFNTEAHPLPAFNWTESERLAFNMSAPIDHT